MLITGDYNRDDLSLRYTVRELRAFLVTRQVVTDGCTEKSDLVELMMKINPASNRSCCGEDAEHMMHVTRLKEKMMMELQSETSVVSNNAATTDQTFGQLTAVMVSSVLPSSNQNHPVSGETTVPSVQTITSELHISVFPEHSDGASVLVHDASDVHSIGIADAVESDEAMDHQDHDLAGEIQSEFQSSVESADPVLNNVGASTAQCPRMTLDELHDATSIDELTVRQLKALLVNNFVDYKGCCEKQELRERVRQLWNDHVRNTNFVSQSTAAAAGADSSFDTNLCKVCMDAVIDCILLECGHMVTCTGCGKQLSECPICRRYVTRVVHVFRA
jgi:hypothetical protein